MFIKIFKNKRRVLKLTRVRIIYEEPNSPTFKNYRINDVVTIDGALAQHWQQQGYAVILDDSPSNPIIDSKPKSKKGDQPCPIPSEDTKSQD
jgi:hypothetical protein